MRNPVEMFEGVNSRIFDLRAFIEDARLDGHMLWLTGSRYFGGAKEKSDWDFFCEDHKGLGTWLKGHGFRHELGHVREYKDIMTISVYVGSVGVTAESKVHVQIVKSGTTMLKAQAALKETKALIHAQALMGLDADPTNKKHMKKLIWDLAITAVQGGN